MSWIISWFGYGESNIDKDIAEVQNLPRLPFNYNKYKTHIVRFDGDFTAFDENHYYGDSLYVISDLDWQLLRYLRNHFSCKILLPGVKENEKLDEGDEHSPVVSFHEFLQHIIPVSNYCDSEEAQEKTEIILSKLLRMEKLYDSYGDIAFCIQWWFDFLYAEDEDENIKLSELLLYASAHEKVVEKLNKAKNKC
jgi:hypothetical protein